MSNVLPFHISHSLPQIFNKIPPVLQHVCSYIAQWYPTTIFYINNLIGNIEFLQFIPLKWKVMKIYLCLPKTNCRELKYKWKNPNGGQTAVRYISYSVSISILFYSMYLPVLLILMILIQLRNLPNLYQFGNRLSVKRQDYPYYACG